MNVLLLYPNAYGMNMLPPSMGIFTAILKERGHKVALFDSTQYSSLSELDFDKAKAENLNARPFDDTKLKEGVKESDPYEDFRNLVEKFKPDIIAASMVEDTYFRGVALLQSLGNKRPFTVAGGVFPTFAPILTLDNAQGTIDVVLRGEGEESLPLLCERVANGQDYFDVAGLAYRKNGEYRQNPLPTPVDINSVPIPDYSLFEESRFYRPMQGKTRRMLPISTIRGCPYKCTYCNSPSQLEIYKAENGENFLRKLMIDRVYEELKVMRDVYKADSFYFWADTFLAWTNKEIERFCEMYSDIGLPFWIQTRPETINDFNIKRLKEVGLLRVAFGIEHGSEEFRERVLLRRVKNDEIIRKLKIVTDLDIPISVNNIMGFPDETRELAFETIELNRQIKSDGINAYTFVPFHGTHLRELCEKRGYIKPGKIVSSEVMNLTTLDMPQFTKEQIEGVRRCFVLYTKMPKSRWADIQKAESLTPEGDKIYRDLKDECLEKYMNYGDYEKNDDVEKVVFEK
jgi:anaerobic magnesium-protoporphyrin IX monomethyl ester cyclase